MLFTIDPASRAEDAVLRGMFEARKRVFIDLLGWDVPVLAGRYEVDQFDNPLARYLVLASPEHEHQASARLLPTTRPHILDSLFAELCDTEPPRGEDVFEITRFCLDPRPTAPERRRHRDALVLGLAHYALEHGITRYTGVAELGWLRQILGFGWRCRLLGPARRIGGSVLGALQIDIAPDTPALLSAFGIGEPAVQLEAEAA